MNKVVDHQNRKAERERERKEEIIIIKAKHYPRLTRMRAGNKPQTPVFLGSVFQGDPKPKNPAQRFRVEKGGVLMGSH